MVRVGRIISTNVMTAQMAPTITTPAGVTDQLAKSTKPWLPVTMPMVRKRTGRAVWGIQAISEPATMALKITSVQEAAKARGALSVRLAIV